MNLDRVGPGARVPDEFNVIVEIPLRGEPVKYEIDKQTGAMYVDRFLNTAMHYPCNYGYVPRTLSEDGDPLDVLLVCDVPLIPGAVIACRPVGVLAMTDEAGPDAKVLAVPADRLSGFHRHVTSPRDLPAPLLDQIAHFFAHYKDLEPAKWVRVDGWLDAQAARDLVLRALVRHNDAPVKPAF